MTKEDLFNKYSINESHNIWDSNIDNWWSVEVYLLMKGHLPAKDDYSLKYLLDFLDNRLQYFHLEGFGSMYLTTKRMVYKHSEDLISELNNNIKNEQSNNKR